MPSTVRPPNAPLPPTTVVAPTSAPTATTTAAPAATTIDPPAPSAGGALVDASLAGGARALAPGLLQGLAAGAAGPSRFAMVAGKFPQCVSLPDVLNGLAAKGQLGPFVQALAAKVEEETGVKLPPALIAAAIANPARIADLVALTPQQLRAGFDALNAAHRAGVVKKSAPKSRQLPMKVDLAKAYDVKRGEPTIKEIAPGLFHGDVKGDLPDEQTKARIVFAEVLDRLSENSTTKAPADRFQVKYGAHECTRVETLLQAMLDDGYQLEVELAHRTADFASLKLMPGPGVVLDVPAAILVKTGVKDAHGVEAQLPVGHSELVLRLKPGPTTKGPKIDAEVMWYQGVPQTGFFPRGLNRPSTWLGRVVPQTWEGKDAARAVSLAALFGDVVNTASQKKGFVMAGYGVTGVCNDSIALVQQVMSGRATGYPFSMIDAVVDEELNARLAKKDRRDDPEYRALRAAVDVLPTDDIANDTSTARALSSIPWPAGEAPFPSVEDARRILSQP